MSCPFFFLALSFIAGLLFAAFRPWPPGLGIPVVLLPLGCGWLLWGKSRIQTAAAWAMAAAAALGALVYAAADSRYEENGLARLPAFVYADLRGTVVRSLAPGLDRDYLTLQVSRVGQGGREIPMSGRVRVSIAHSASGAPRPDVLVGDEIRIAAQIVPPKEYRNFEEPFSRRYLRAQSLHALAATKSPLLLTMIRPGPAWSPRRFISRLRRACLRRIERAFAAPAMPGGISPEGAFLEALVLGERGRVGADINLNLQETGLLHLLAISGAHIGIIAALLFGVLRAAGASRRKASAVLIILLVLYAFLVEGQASVTRAILMALLYFSGGLLWKDVRLLNTLGLSALIILLDNPFQIHDMGFALTYAATLFILLFFEPVLSRLPRLPLKISETLAMSISAQMGVLPLIASSFHRLTISGLLLNLPAIPIISLLLAAGYLFLPLSFLGGPILHYGAAALGALTDVFLGTTHLLDNWPGLSIRIPAPPLWVSAGFYAAVLLSLVPGRDRARRMMTAGAAGFFLVLLIDFPYPTSTPNLRLTFLDVGHGDSILIEFPGREKMLIDAGGLPTGTFDIGESVVSPFLWLKGIRKIGTLVLTHPHPDHRNGMPAVARNFRIGEFWQTAPEVSDPVADSLRKALGPAGRFFVEAGHRQTIGGVDVEVFAPAKGNAPRASDENNGSVVLKLTYGSISFLLPGDIGAETERRLVESGVALRSTILKSPHHGSRSSSSERFLDAVSPGFVVISVGRDNRYGLPDPEVVARYARRGLRILRTDRDGAVEISTDGVRVAVRTAAGGD
jgi:competence protein ComEC